MRIRAGALGVFLVGLGFPALAGATVPMGTIDGLLDGEAVQWRTLDVPAEGTATAEIRSIGPMTMVSIQGHREGESIMRHVLSLQFSIMEGAGDIMDATISYFPDGMRSFYVDEHPEAATSIEVTRLDFGDGAAAQGTFSATLCLREGMMAEVDLGDCREIEGAFETQLRVAD